MAAHAGTHERGGNDPIRLDDLAEPQDNVDLNSNTLRHGLLPKLSGNSTDSLQGNGTWGLGGSASAADHFVTTQAESNLSSEFSLGSLTTGMLKHTVSAGVSTPATATAATDYVAPGAVTTSGLTQATGKLLGRTTASTGAIEEITAGTGLTLSSGTLSVSGTGVNSATFEMMAGDNATAHSPADGTTYHFGTQAGFNPGTGAASFTPVMPKNGTVKICVGVVRVLGTLGSAGSSTVTVVNLTASTSETVTSSLAMSSVTNNFSNTSMTLAFSAGDRLEITILTPTWGTNPTAVVYVVAIYVEYS